MAEKARLSGDSATVDAILATPEESSESTMSAQAEPHIPLRKGWNKHVRPSLLHVISLAQFAAAYTRGWGRRWHQPTA